ncbi:MAG: tyrosine-protein phosphatase [Erysipelotrichaceae bacterium]
MINYNRLPLEHAYNVRDLGGYASANGMPTNYHRYLRSDDISTLTNADIKLLLDYGVTKVIDLRSVSETMNNVDKLKDMPNITYVNIPFMKGTIDNVMNAKNIVLKDFYIDLLKDKSLVNSIMSELAKPISGCLLFHCSAGKDRTGIVSMLLLSLVGVSSADIISNYEVTFTYLMSNPKLRNYMANSNFDLSLMHSDPSSISACLDFIYDNYASTEKYLLDCGLSIEQINSIKKNFVS